MNNATALVNITSGGLIGPTSGTHTIGLTGHVALGTYELFGFSGTAPALGGFRLGNTLDSGFGETLQMSADRLDLVVAVPSVSAAWNFNGNDSYSNAAQWTPQQPPTGVGNTATFGNGDGLSGSTTVNTPAVTVTIDGNYTVGSLVLENTHGTSYTLGNGGAGTGLALDNSGSGSLISVSATAPQQITASLTLADNTTFNIATGSSLAIGAGNVRESGGSRSLTKTGAGALTIDTPSSYSGGTIVGNGTLTLTGAGTIGAGPLEVDGLGGNTSLVNLQNSQAVAGLSGTASGGGSARVDVAAGTSLTVSPASGSSTYGGTLDLVTGASGGKLIESGAGTQVLTTAPILETGSSLQISGGTLRIAATTGAAGVGSGVTANISDGGTLELAGTVSALGTATVADRVNVATNSTADTLLISGGNQIVGGIDGSGTVQVMVNATLTANHISAGALVIGGDAANSAMVTIGASDTNGQPTAVAIDFALDGSLGPSDSPTVGSASASSLIAADSASSAGASPRMSAPTIGALGNTLGSTAVVPEPSTLLLLALGILACLLALWCRATPASRLACGPPSCARNSSRG